MMKTGAWKTSEKIVKQRENLTLHQVAKEPILHTLNWLYLCLDSKKYSFSPLSTPPPPTTPDIHIQICQTNLLKI